MRLDERERSITARRTSQGLFALCARRRTEYRREDVVEFIALGAAGMLTDNERAGGISPHDKQLL